MKKLLNPFILLLLVWAASSCDRSEPSAPLDGDYVEVRFSIAGNFENPFIPSSRSSSSYEENLADTNKYKPKSLPEGSTLWLLLEELDKESDAEIPDTFFAENSILRSFVVDSEGLLMPCVADTLGNLVERTTKPLYLKRGKWYRARAIGPARKLTDDHSMYITNNQYVYAHDYRYERTKHSVFKIGFDKPVENIVLNPVIHQTAELKFTIEAENDKFTVDDKILEYSPVHSLEVMPAGVVVTGLQEHYSLGAPGSEPYNWTLGKNYLYAYPGHVNNYMTIYDPVETSDDPPKLVFKGAIMPTDAVANPIIVGFYLRVNGVPTMFQMMLNRKMFLHAYCYHYKGTIKIQRGVAVLEWQTVAHEFDVDLPLIDNSGNGNDESE